MQLVTLNEIAEAINRKLKEALPGIKINTKDIKEGFDRPSLYVDFDNSSKSPFGSRGIERNLHIFIYFFPTSKDRYKLEVLEVQEKLENAFTYTLEIKEGFIVYLDELQSDKVDGVLQFSFDLTYIEIDEIETGEEIEELSLNI